MKTLVLLLAASPALAGNYYVAKHGDDHNDGVTRTTAFATVQRGVSALQPGDTLTIGPGEYAETITRNDLGSMEADTIIRAETPGTVLLRGDVPAPEFRPLAGHRFVYEADFRFDGPIPCVNELDTLSILKRMPNITEVEFIPGTFFHDAKEGKLYVSSSDLKSPATHRYSVSVKPDNGLYLLHPKRVIIEGLTFTGFNAMTLVHYSKGTAGSVWGAFLMSARQCVIRDCAAYLNGFGIALNSQEPGSGDNVIERCKAWGNSSQFVNGDMGGITAYGARRELIRDCAAWRNGVYGINIYGTGGAPPNGNDGGNTPENKSRVVGCIAWGNESADLKVKTGYDYFHTVENCICSGLLHANNVTHTIFGKWTSADKNTDPSNAELSEKKADEMKKLQRAMSSSPSAVRAPASLHIVSPPFVRSISATTANIEWTTSLPAVCRIAWGDTAACEQSATLDVHHWGSYSLTGLKPGQRYYFAVTELSVPKVSAEKMDAKPVKLGAEVINFTTKTQDAAPQTFYVATDGDDTRSGRSRAEAWRSIRHAADTVNVGDTVLIAGGKYSERVRMRATGAKNAPITFKAMPGERVDLDGSEQALNGAFVSIGKTHLRFDGFYFANFNLFPNHGWLPVQGADFQLAHGSDITISRCFSDGRGGYSAVPVIAAFVNRLTIENCVNTYKFGGGFYVWRCPELLVRNCVFAEPMIQAFVLRNEKVQPSMMEKCIFTDMLDKKARLNIALLCCDGEIDAFRNRDCCYFLRDCIPLKERAMNGSATIDKLTAYILDPLFADPLFAGDPGAKGDASDKSGFSPDRLMDSALKLDFHSFFATNPELNRRGIGLQREAFSDFHFNRPAKR